MRNWASKQTRIINAKAREKKREGGSKIKRNKFYEELFAYFV
jgi:hypothetical protein